MSFFSTNYSRSIDAGLLILRIGLGGLVVPHGYDKIVNFATYKSQFINFLGMGPTVSLILCIFAEFFCALLVVFGLFTRFAAIPLVINFLVALFMATQTQDIFGKDQLLAVFVVGFLGLSFTGGGRFSADALFRR